MRVRVLAAALAACVAAGASAGDGGHSDGPADPSLWESHVAPYDWERLTTAPAAFGTAMRAALAEGTPEDVATLTALFAEPPQPIDPPALIGDWRCRTIKLGGPYGALTIYGWFDCRIRLAPEGLRFEKITGSQRTSGRLFAEEPLEGVEPRMVYLGAAHYGYEAPIPYDGGSELWNEPENRNDPGFLVRIGEGHARIEFPWPILESDYDILELRR